MRVAEQRRPLGRLIDVTGVMVALAILIIGLLTPINPALGTISPGHSPVGTLLAFAAPTLLAGLFSFLAPGTLAILPISFACTL